MRTAAWPAVAITAALALIAGCSGASGSRDRAGGLGAEQTTVLTFAQPSPSRPEELDQWAEEVERRSGGAIRIDFKDAWRRREPGVELGIIKDVQQEKVDLGWVGARAFDQAGMTTFEPLLAPFLIDSNDLQRKVFESGIPDQMMTGLARVDLAGIAVVPGPLRRMLGVNHPFRSASDFHGEEVGIQASDLSDQTMAALGASARPLGFAGSIHGLDGVEQQLGTIASNTYTTDGGTITGNLNFWPRAWVVFARDGQLSDEQLDVMTAAAASVVPDTFDEITTEDARAAAHLCVTGVPIVTANMRDLRALRRAVQPVYDGIASDPNRADDLAQIQRLKAVLGAPADSITCRHTSKPSAKPEDNTDSDGDAEVSSPVRLGTYTSTWDSPAITKACGGDQGDEPGTAEWTFKEDGTAEIYILTPKREPTFEGTYEFFRDQLRLTDADGTISAHFTFDGKNLRLSDFADTATTTPDGCLEVALGGRPWTLP